MIVTTLRAPALTAAVVFGKMYPKRPGLRLIVASGGGRVASDQRRAIRRTFGGPVRVPLRVLAKAGRR
jgi:hypothetical protein